MNVSIAIKLLDGVTGPLRKVQQSVAAASKSFTAVREKADHSFEKAEHIHQSGQALDRFAEKAREAVEKIVRPFEAFEEAMSRVRGATKTTEAEMKDMSEAARKLGSQGRFGATEMAQALGGLRAEGFSAAEAIAALPSVADAAVVANKSLGETIAETTNIMDAFGLKNTDMTRLLNIVAATAPAAGTSISNINAALAETGRDAASAGISLERMAELTGLLATKSIEGARAGSTLGIMLKVLKNPGTEQKQIFKQMGVALTEGTGKLQKMRDPLQIMIDLQNKMNKSGVSAAGQLHAMSVLFPRAESDVNALLDASKGDGLGKLREALKDTTGRVKEMADITRENGAEAARDLSGAFNELSMTIGETMAPALEHSKRIIIDVVRTMTQWLKAHPAVAQALGNLIRLVAVVATALAGLTTVLAAGAAAKGMMLLAFGTKSFVVALAPLAGAAIPILAIGAAIGAVTLAVVQLVKAWDTLDVGESFRGIKDAFGDGSFFKTMTLNPFSGLGGDSLGSPLGAEASPEGKLHIQIDSEGKPAIKNMQAKGIELEASAGMAMAH